MLETIDLDRTLDKEKYGEHYSKLSGELRTLQRRCHEKRVPVIILFEGWDMSGKGETINRLVKRLDPRGLRIHTTFEATEPERLFPFLHSFWLRLPEDGDIVIFDRSWYRRILSARAKKLVSKRERFQTYDAIRQFERQLIDHGSVFIKFWLHLGKKEQARRLKKVAGNKYERWRVGHFQGSRKQQYKRYAAGFEEVFERTSTHHAPWTVVPATDRRYCVIDVLETICDNLAGAVRSRRGRKKPAASQVEAAERPRLLDEKPVVLKKVDMAREISKDQYLLELKEQQLRIRENEFEIFRHRIPVVVAYEGWDAAGKGGNIKRATESLDPRGYSVIPIAAPRGEEKNHHYLWRFWRQVPKAGHLAIFDRSWYGRVLVERVEGLTPARTWTRAYQEIKEFESQLANSGTVLIKFWIHITLDEQLARFKERKRNKYKRFKLTDDDWRNREKWPAYERAVSDMLLKTSTTYAPWTVIEGNCKYFARVKALKTINEAIEQGIKKFRKKER